MPNMFNYVRRESSPVQVGDITIGGNAQIRIQSMTTTNTNDTEGSVAQAERIIDAGGELVRLTTQGVREAENMKNINALLRSHGYNTPLVADVHFNPNVADVAALYCEKVRINPGNYIDPARTFKHLEYTDEEYAEELQRLDNRLVPFLNICKEHNTAIRIGVNHGSLSDRIMSHYGDTPAGIVESCMEFLRICKRENFNNVVISIKASNTVVMVQSVRLLVQQMEKENMNYPLHLGVTEAGEGEDGRIKSAVGIGALLSDGIGDTIRVSLSEEPEAEIPVAKSLVDYITARAQHTPIPAEPYPGFCYEQPQRRKTHAVGNIGGNNVPVVIAPQTSDEIKPDYVFASENYLLSASGEKCPLFSHTAMPLIGTSNAEIKFLVLQYGVNTEEYSACLKAHPEVVVVAVSNHKNRVGELRALIHEMTAAGITNPVVVAQMYRHSAEEKEMFQLEAAADMGALMFDGLVDGIWLLNDGTLAADDIAATSFAILQAGRLRTTKTEYISCPGCGRTLYDLRSTIARIKAATSHLKHLKIGIMGCIVNGPGEMADADYGYVGAGRGKISLYRKKECVLKNIPEEEAVEKLLELIANDEKNK
ncbi:MAG: 4-hydroxy-3-methylbut-2-en-1-yl diphosphate synthase [Prevotella sp.]|nr:4-hydroxy-3-methylbut-2-en-1-yl diphosphate synthase [Prevotella sp.]MBO5205644.1 4-hydroxy-3-methylbut-2-en-1-yl diphosphate synthase [Prevotella sp.]